MLTKEILIEKSRITVVKLPINFIFSAVLLNYNDLTFVKVNLDSNSELFFVNNLYKLKDPLS